MHKRDNPSGGIDMQQLLIYILIGLVILAAMQTTQPIQQQAPTYDGNTWHSTVIIEDNDTNISVDGCIGYCPDQ